jgi:DNA repair exonuclease SbcCD ATPase subunit
MENNMNKTNLVLIVLLILSLLFGGWSLIKNKSNKNEALKTKSVLMAEKDMLNKDLKDMAAEKKKAIDLNRDLNSRIGELLKEIEIKNNERQRLLADNAKVNVLRKNLKEMEQERNALKNLVDNQKSSIEELNKSNSDLQVELQALQAEQERLNTELMLVKSIHSSDFLVRGVKKNQKITAVNRWTKTIKLSFDFPEKYINDLEVNILTPDKETFTTSANKDLISLTQSGNVSSVYPSGLAAKGMELSLKPDKKFAKGIYKFTVLKGTETVATMQLQLK